MCSLSSSITFTYFWTRHLGLPAHRHGASGFLQEIGGFGVFWGGGGLFFAKCQWCVQPSYLPDQVPNEKHSRELEKALQKHLFLGLCFSLVLGLSQADSPTPTALGGRWGLHRCLRGWHGQWQCPNQGMPGWGAAPRSSPLPLAEGSVHTDTLIPLSP